MQPIDISSKHEESISIKVAIATFMVEFSGGIMPNFESLKIDNFIFHVVHHGEDIPILLNEASIAGFESFFISRVKDTLKGNRFNFNEGSQTLRSISAIDQDPTLFVQESKKLAVDFHSRQDKRIKPGVLILIALSDNEEKYYSIIKYDHEEVLTYKFDQSEPKAIMEEVKNSFTKSKESLHKSALISLHDGTGEAVVIDRTIRADITDFFKGFLNVKRKYSTTELTKTINDALVETAFIHKESLPQPVTRNIRKIIYDAIQVVDNFEPEGFVQLVFGANSSDQLQETFSAIIKKKDLDGESFVFDKQAVLKPRERKFKTIEGVQIKYGSEAEGTVKISDNDSADKTIITITTSKLTEL